MGEVGHPCGDMVGGGRYGMCNCQVSVKINLKKPETYPRALIREYTLNNQAHKMA